MKITKTISINPIVSAEVEISTKELELLETALSIARRDLSLDKIEKLFGENLELNYLLEDIQNVLKECEKSQPELPPKENLKNLVSKFRKWLADNYTEEKIKENLIDDAGYPNWKDIENYFSALLANNQLNLLDSEDKINLLYLIARNWDIGSMIGWLSPNRPLSHCGNLSDKDFIDLAGIVAKLHHLEFNDAKCQFASSFKKFDELTPEIEEILLQIYETGDDYSKRLALISLAKLDFNNIRSLIKQTWIEEDSELVKIDCLRAIDEYLLDKDLLNEYLIKAEPDNRKLISEYVAKLKNKTKNEVY